MSGMNEKRRHQLFDVLRVDCMEKIQKARAPLDDESTKLAKRIEILDAKVSAIEEKVRDAAQKKMEAFAKSLGLEPKRDYWHLTDDPLPATRQLRGEIDMLNEKREAVHNLIEEIMNGYGREREGIRRAINLLNDENEAMVAISEFADKFTF